MAGYSFYDALPANAHTELSAYPELLRSLLYHRGITTGLDAHQFLNPSYETGLYDPFLIKDMDKAVARILEAIKNNERILIYSDYDADGIPAAVVMADFFKAINYENSEVYIPHRHKEGYGLHEEAIESFKDRVKLMITLDCGIVDHHEVAHAKSAGIDVIVTDHHLPSETLPDAYAVLNSKRADCEYPYKMLCGAGVAFKLVQALLQKGNFTIKEGAEKWLLDMVGIATLSDMVPLRDENRVFAHYGLKVLQKSRRPGLVKLLKMLGMSQPNLSEDDVAFMITPRINAASRMGIPTDAFKLLATVDEVEADQLAKHLDEINQERKGLVGSLVREIKKVMTERADHFAALPVIVLGNPDWRPAILGLAASSLVEEYGKPVFLWGREDGVLIKGSCRSDGTVSVVDVMAATATLGKEIPPLESFGGHMMSGGFALMPDAIHHLEDALVAAHAKVAKTDLGAQTSFIDSVLTLDDVSWQTQKLISQMAPFGIDNPKPLFLFKNVKPESVRMFGKRPEHLELSFNDFSGKPVKAIGFFMKPEDFAVVPAEGKTFDLVATLEKSFFRFKSELRLRIVDII
jgi:single-stranded-DNA-specific exonuclease